MKKNWNKKIIGGCLAGTIAVLLCILGIKDMTARHESRNSIGTGLEIAEAGAEEGLGLAVDETDIRRQTEEENTTSEDISAETEQEAPEMQTIAEEVEEETAGEARSLPEQTGHQPAKAAEQPMTETAKQGSGIETESAPAESQTAIETGTEGAAVMEERIVYQPDFYYEPINEEVKSRIYGLSYKEDCTVPYDELRYVRVRYINFNGSDKTGELICNKAIAQDLVEIFYELYLAQYPIEQIRLIDEYGADDLLSMKDNNTSCFNYRVVEGSTKLSKHARGLAIDINPFYNPYVDIRDGRVSPEESAYYADRTKTFAYKIDENDLCYKLFTEHGFFWGGNWKTTKDYQHFQKDV